MWMYSLDLGPHVVRKLLRLIVPLRAVSSAKGLQTDQQREREQSFADGSRAPDRPNSHHARHHHQRRIVETGKEERANVAALSSVSQRWTYIRPLDTVMVCNDKQSVRPSYYKHPQHWWNIDPDITSNGQLAVAGPLPTGVHLSVRI